MTTAIGADAASTTRRRTERAVCAMSKTWSLPVAAREKQVTFPLDVLFHAAIREGDMDEVVTLVELLATTRQPCAKLPVDLQQRSSCGGLTALHLCCLAGRLHCVEKLVDSGACVFAQDTAGWTCLHVAAWASHEHIVRYLLQLGGRRLAESRAKDGRCAIDVAKSKMAVQLLSSLPACHISATAGWKESPTSAIRNHLRQVSYDTDRDGIELRT